MSPRGREKRTSRELRWIEWIRKLEGPISGKSFPAGIGDDAAIWTPSRGSSVVMTVDVQVEGVHFRRDWFTPREIGERAVVTSLSDLAAMAAIPVCLLVSLVIEKERPEGEFKELHRGIKEAARRYGVRILGGNLSAGPFCISITAMGEGRAEGLIRRSGARPGDDIWVTGAPGLSRLGLLCLERGLLEGAEKRRRKKPAGGSRRSLPGCVLEGIRAFKRPVAKVKEALYLSRAFRPTAMIDLSDGIATDLGHLLDESSRKRGKPLGAVLDEESFLGMRQLQALAAFLDQPVAGSALRGGEDYELCFTARPEPSLAGEARAFSRRFALPLTRLGRIVERPGIKLKGIEGPARAVVESGWQHF